MQILSSGSDPKPTESVVLIFGLGMIGSAISNSLRFLNYQLREEIAFDWSDIEKRAQAQTEIEAVCRLISATPKSFSVVWSAGSTTFHSGTDEIAQEKSTFSESIGFIKNLQQSLNPKKFVFHFISSAGGLFEGQRVVNNVSKPAPMRPYGQLKLAQEQALMSLFKTNELAFYRPSSVYGPNLQNTQKGLINNLVTNGRNERVTVLDAHVMSLRDYVFSRDIGTYVARAVLSSSNTSAQPVRLLVSSRCTSIFEVVRKIERILNLNLRVRYDVNFGNHRNITFSDRVLPLGWQPSTLEIGLRQFLVDAG